MGGDFVNWVHLAWDEIRRQEILKSSKLRGFRQGCDSSSSPEGQPPVRFCSKEFVE